MSEFTIFAVDFYELTLTEVAVIHAEVAPSIRAITGPILERENALDESVTMKNICIDHMQPTKRARDLAEATSMFADKAMSDARAAQILSKIGNANVILGVLVDAPESDNYFVVETKHAHVESIADCLTGI